MNKRRFFFYNEKKAKKKKKLNYKQYKQKIKTKFNLS